MFGSFYSKLVFPYRCEFAMSGDLLNGFRKDELKKTNREVLEIPQIDRMQSKHNSATCISAHSKVELKKLEIQLCSLSTFYTFQSELL